jgi:thymidylate synthase
MFSAWIANTMALRCLQQEVALRLNIAAGELITISQSAHIYKDDWHDAQIIVEQQYKQNQKITFSDLVGNFLIDARGKQIVVSQTTPGNGEIIACYSGTKPLNLIREIAAANPTINPEHIGYLGIELEKAHKLGFKYKQDK